MTETPLNMAEWREQCAHRCQPAVHQKWAKTAKGADHLRVAAMAATSSPPITAMPPPTMAAPSSPSKYDSIIFHSTSAIIHFTFVTPKRAYYARPDQNSRIQ